MFSSTIVTNALLPLLLCLQAPNYQESIDVLIKRLGSPHFQEREVATQQLLERWPDAIPALKEALESSDPEVVNRAAMILKEFERRPLKRLKYFINEGKVDQAIELLTCWPKGKYEEDCWQMTRKLIYKLSEAHKNPNRGIGVQLLKATDAMPIVISVKRFTKDVRDRNTFLFARASKVDLASYRDANPASDAIIFASSDVQIRSSFYRCSAVFSCASVRINQAIDMLIVSDGDVTVEAASNCVIIARGQVTCQWLLANCRIISGKSVVRPRRLDVSCSTIIENESKPLSFIQFFDPAQEGITVEEAKAGVRITKLAAGKPFQQAGLRKGDLITAVNDEAARSPEVFRRLLRRHIAWEEEMTFHVRRDGKEVQIRLPRVP